MDAGALTRMSVSGKATLTPSGKENKNPSPHNTREPINAKMPKMSRIPAKILSDVGVDLFILTSSTDQPDREKASCLVFNFTGYAARYTIMRQRYTGNPKTESPDPDVLYF
jgi:hypothetical protein